MINLKFHKGTPCVYKPILCQEGWCYACAIYQMKSAKTQATVDNDIFRLPEKSLGIYKQ